MPMTIARTLACVALLAGAALAPPATAHHSFAMFDNTRSITLHGSVTEFKWQNPHAYLEIDADSGTHFTLEMTSPNMMSRGGWTSRTIRTGDVVTAYVAPLRDGRNGGLLLEVVLPNGRHMLPGVPNANRYHRSDRQGGQ